MSEFNKFEASVQGVSFAENLDILIRRCSDPESCGGSLAPVRTKRGIVAVRSGNRYPLRRRDFDTLRGADYINSLVLEPPEYDNLPELLTVGTATTAKDLNGSSFLKKTVKVPIITTVDGRREIGQNWAGNRQNKKNIPFIEGIVAAMVSANWMQSATQQKEYLTYHNLGEDMPAGPLAELLRVLNDKTIETHPALHEAALMAPSDLTQAIMKSIQSK